MRKSQLGHLLAAAWISAWLAVAAPGQAAETPALISEMLANAPTAAESRCGYTRLSIHDDGSKLERFDPSANPPWMLLAVDERDPTPRELRRYAEKVDRYAERRHPLAFDLTDIVEPGSWSVLSETEDEAVYGFRLRPDDVMDEDLLAKVRATLTVGKHPVQPRRILIETTGPAYVAPMVRIASYRQELRFVWNDSVGASALAEKITQRRGRALGLRNLRDDKRVSYSDYRCAVYAEELPPGMPLEN